MDLRHDINILVSIAKIDADLSGLRTELQGLPGKLDLNAKMAAEAERSEKEANDHLQQLKKERRDLEVKLEDDAELVKKYKTQLLDIKTNKEYTALLKEIENLEKEIDGKEERLLILMDEIEAQAGRNDAFMKKIADEKSSLEEDRKRLEQRMNYLEAEIKRLEGQKPALLKELDTHIKKKYERLLSKWGDFAVTNVVNEICQGCFSRIPPQTVNEVKKNDQIVCCEGCGRILVHY